jgi:DHA2 family multidrug resistance protein
MYIKSSNKIELAIWVVLTIVGVFMAVLDTTIVDIMVPRLQGPLSTDLYGVQWVITAYMISAAIGFLVTDSIIKLIGNKNTYILGISIFTIFSLLCGVSNSLGFIIFSRVLQGFGEALILVSAKVMIFNFFPPQKRGIAMGIFALGVAFAPAVGPTLGGYLTEYFSWRMAFFINVPVGIVLIIFGSLLLPDKSQRQIPKINIFSLLFLSIATVSLLVLLSKGQQYGWLNSSFIVYLIFTTILSTLFFAISEIISKIKLFEYSLFKNYHFTIGALIFMTLFGFSMFQYFYLLPYFYEHIKGLPSSMAGIGVLGFGIWIGIFSIVAGKLVDKFSPSFTLTIAGILYLISTLVLIPTINYYTPFYIAVIKTMLFGIALGMFFAPITVLIINNSGEFKEQSVLITDYLRFIGAGFGTAIATNNLVYFTEEKFNAINEFQNQTLTSSILEKLHSLYSEMGNVLFSQYEKFMAMNYGYHSVWMHAGLWGVVGVVFIFMLLLKKEKN